MIIYKVEQNDTIFKIAQKFGSTVAKIKELNKISEVRYGERILVPTPSGKDYTVGPFETLSSISKKLDVNLDSLTKINGNEVKIGETIKLPL